MIAQLVGDCRALLPTLPAGRFRTCVTSPPYWEQREYLPDGHPLKHLEVGHEPTPAAYVEQLVLVFREVRRVLADDGTLWIVIGDKYTADGGRRPGGGQFGTHNRLVDEGRVPRKIGPVRTPGLPSKCLIGLPWLLAFGLQADGWILRADVIWNKPDAQPSSVKDRPTTAHEYVFLLAKNEHYFYDQDATREPRGPARKRGGGDYAGRTPRARGNLRDRPEIVHPLGRNARSVWTLATSNGDGKHAAPMPDPLARRCVLAGSAPGDHVLDPFGGQGTVGRIADVEGRHATLIDLDAEAAELSRAATVQQGLVPREQLAAGVR
jgi:DNA modification methylase